MGSSFALGPPGLLIRTLVDLGGAKCPIIIIPGLRPDAEEDGGREIEDRGGSNGGLGCWVRVSRGGGGG